MSRLLSVRFEGFDPLVSEPRFWLQDLRLVGCRAILTAASDARTLVPHVARLLPRLKHAQHVADRLGLPTDVTLPKLQELIAGQGNSALPYLLASAFVVGKPPAAALDAARAHLPARFLDGGPKRALDPKLAAMLLVEHAPRALPTVRGLAHWHRTASGHFSMVDPPRTSEPIAPFLYGEALEGAVEAFAPGPGCAPLRVDLRFPAPNGGHIVVIRRNARATYHWDDEGTHVEHGHEEDLTVLHFSDDARSVSLSAPASATSRPLAEAIASAWLGQPVRYEPLAEAADSARVRRMVAMLRDAHISGLQLREIEVQNSRLHDAPIMRLRAPAAEVDISKSVTQYEQMVGSVMDDPANILHMVLVWQGQEARLVFGEQDGRPVVRLAEGRLDRHAAAKFRQEFAHRFGFGLPSVDAA